jgi:hypothetical protein
MRKLPPEVKKPVVEGIVIDPRTTDTPAADAPGVVRLLDVEPTPEQRQSHALRLLRADKGEPEEGGDA